MDKLKIFLQYCYPKHALSRLVGKLAQARLGFISTAFIRLFIRHYQVNMDEALHKNACDYKSFNDFFTRELKANARPIVSKEDELAHPVDGAISQLGDINEGQLIQAKGKKYTVAALLGGDQELAARFHQGSFATIYLSPKDYHRIHMPCDGTLRKMIYVPGELFSVNPLTARHVDNLFARNERVVALFDTALGPMALVLVGATIVASIETVWAGTVTPPRGNSVFSWNYDNECAPTLRKGEEMGRFKLGSTVIALFGRDAIHFEPSLATEVPTRMGELFATRR